MRGTCGTELVKNQLERAEKLLERTLGVREVGEKPVPKDRVRVHLEAVQACKKVLDERLSKAGSRMGTTAHTMPTFGSTSSGSPLQVLRAPSFRARTMTASREA